MGGSNVPKIQESSPSSIECQRDADNFLMLNVLFTTTFLKASQSTRFTTLKYWNVWGTPSDAKGQNCGEVTTGFFITKIIQATQHSELVSFWPNTRSLCFPPYSLDLAACDFFLFPKLKKPRKGRRFETISEVKANATKELKAITKEAYQDCFKKLKHSWDKCARWGREYFKGDSDM